MTDMPSHGHPDGSTHLGRWCGDCPDDHRAFLAAQYDAERAPEVVVEEVAERLHDTWPHLFCDGFQTEVAREAVEAAGPWLAGGEPAADQVARYIAQHGIPTKVPAGAEILRVTAGQIAAEHIGWQVKVHDRDLTAGHRQFTLAGVRSWKRGSRVVVELTDGDDTHGGLYAGTARTYPPATLAELRPTPHKSRRRTR